LPAHKKTVAVTAKPSINTALGRWRQVQSESDKPHSWGLENSAQSPWHV